MKVWKLPKVPYTRKQLKRIEYLKNHYLSMNDAKRTETDEYLKEIWNDAWTLGLFGPFWGRLIIWDRRIKKFFRRSNGKS